MISLFSQLIKKLPITIMACYTNVNNYEKNYTNK